MEAEAGRIEVVAVTDETVRAARPKAQPRPIQRATGATSRAYLLGRLAAHGMQRAAFLRELVQVVGDERVQGVEP